MAKKLLAMALASVALGFASCTLSEPDSESGNASDMRFTGLSSYGVTIMKVTYDSSGRMTEINYAGETKYFMTYSGTSKTPEKIVSEEYDDRWVNGKEEKYLSGLTEWTNIEVNTQGYITKVSEKETQYFEDGDSDVTTGITTFEYDGNHLVKRYYDGELDTSFTWEGDLLQSARDLSEPDYPEVTTYEYSDVENQHRQWDPNNQSFGPIAVSGFFGEAPAKFFKSEKYTYDGYVESYVQFAYTLLENGLINMGKVYDGEGDVMLYNFQYQKK